MINLKWNMKDKFEANTRRVRFVIIPKEQKMQQAKAFPMR